MRQVIRNTEGKCIIPRFHCTFNNVLTFFSPISKDKEAAFDEDKKAKLPWYKESIDVQIATDCISEGQNLQDCDELINYDIHWNPVRIIQRFGRIDRIGSRNKQIQLVNYWPDMELDAVERFQLLVNYKQWKDASLGTFDIVKTFTSEWLIEDTFSGENKNAEGYRLIRIDASPNMDALYESLVRQIAKVQIISAEKDLHQAVVEAQEIENIQKEMASIKKREAKERQPQKKFALHQQYLRLKKKLEGR